MLPSLNRLRHDKDFQNCFSKGKAFYNEDFMLKTVHNQLGLNRFGIIVANKISKKAVVRNKIRRRIRESLRRLLPQMKGDYDCILLTKRNISSVKYSDVGFSLELLLKKAHIL